MNELRTNLQTSSNSEEAPAPVAATRPDPVPLPRDIVGVPGAHHVAPTGTNAAAGVEVPARNTDAAVNNSAENQMTPLEARLVVPRANPANTTSPSEEQAGQEQSLPLHHATPVHEGDEKKRDWLPIVATLGMLVVIVLLALGISGAFNGQQSGDEGSSSDPTVANDSTVAEGSNPFAMEENNTIQENDFSTIQPSAAASPSLRPAATRRPALESIRERGYLRCADIEVPFSGFINTDPDTGRKSGFYGELVSACTCTRNNTRRCPMSRYL